MPLPHRRGTCRARAAHACSSRIRALELRLQQASSVPSQQQDRPEREGLLLPTAGHRGPRRGGSRSDCADILLQCKCTCTYAVLMVPRSPAPQSAPPRSAMEIGSSHPIAPTPSIQQPTVRLPPRHHPRPRSAWIGTPCTLSPLQACPCTICIPCHPQSSSSLQPRGRRRMRVSQDCSCHSTPPHTDRHLASEHRPTANATTPAAPFALQPVLITRT